MKLHWRDPEPGELGDIGSVAAGIVWPNGNEHDRAYENYLQGLVRQYVAEASIWRMMSFILAWSMLAVLVLCVLLMLSH